MEAVSILHGGRVKGATIVHRMQNGEGPATYRVQLVGLQGVVVTAQLVDIRTPHVARTDPPPPANAVSCVTMGDQGYFEQNDTVSFELEGGFSEKATVLEVSEERIVDGGETRVDCWVRTRFLEDGDEGTFPRTRVTLLQSAPVAPPPAATPRTFKRENEGVVLGSQRRRMEEGEVDGAQWVAGGGKGSALPPSPPQPDGCGREGEGRGRERGESGGGGDASPQCVGQWGTDGGGHPTPSHMSPSPRGSYVGGGWRRG